MVNKLISYCARHAFIVILFIVFAAAAGFWALKNIPLDAIPDLSDVQVIIYTHWPGRSPDIVEDQVTYPIVSRMVSAPDVQSVRAQTMFGDSFIYVIFKDGTDIYWARSRVVEYLQGLQNSLPEGVTPVIGPDASGVGWVFEYALVDKSGKHNLQELRSFQDWHLRYWLESVDGVSEVASVGGFVKQYQINVDPNKLAAYNLPLTKVIEAVRRSNNDVGGRELEMATTEYFIRGRGYIHSIKDIEQIPVGTDGHGTPITIKDVGYVELGPDIRRGVADVNGEGETVGGIVVMRYGENALDAINRVKKKLEQVKASLPEGVQVVTTYDRSELIDRSISTLRHKLIEEMIVVSLVIIIFLLHFRSALIPILTLPIAVLLAFIPMYYLGINANIMSLGGIAIAIGAMADAAIILIENSHKNLEHWDAGGRLGSRKEVVIKSFQEVGRSVFFSLLIITVSFLPVFTLQEQEGRLFNPLAYTKTFSMLFAALLSVTLAPALGAMLIRGKIWPEDRHPISRILQRLYSPVLYFVVRHRKMVITAAVVLVATTVPLYLKLGSEFMPPLNEGSILYMPTSVPGISITEAAKILQLQDRILRQFPEVTSVFGKIGRSTTSTDPAPLDMVETTVLLKPQDQWPRVREHRWYSNWAPEFLKPLLRVAWPEERPMTWNELINQMQPKLNFPGMPPVWWMPIQTRTEMLNTGIRSNLGIKVSGADLGVIQKVSVEIEKALQDLPGTRSIFAERSTGGYFLDFNVNRQAASRYGLTVGDVEDVIESAIGGKNISQTIEGRERYPINVRYSRGFRGDLETLGRVLVPTPTGAQIPLSMLADIHYSMGPPMIRDEEGQLTGYVFVDVTANDYEGYVRRAQHVIDEKVTLPPGYTLEWAGQYQYLIRMKQRLKYVIPVTLAIIFILLYLNFGSWKEPLIVFCAVPFSLVGAVWLLYLLGYNLSVAVWVGMIALAGLDAETGVVMLLYLELAYADRKDRGLMRNFRDLTEAVHEGAVKRVRPKMMTVSALIVGLLPIMWAGMSEAGADVMKRIAAPMVGGLVTSFILELAVYPAIFALWKRAEVEGWRAVVGEFIPFVPRRGSAIFASTGRSPGSGPSTSGGD